MSNILKVTAGFVNQVFSEDGKFLSQEFVAGNNVLYEGEDHAVLDDMNFYATFDMCQPGYAEVVRHTDDSTLSAIAVIYIDNHTVQQCHIFHDENPRIAEDKFRELVRKVYPDITDGDLDSYVEDGHYQADNAIITLTHC